MNKQQRKYRLRFKISELMTVLLLFIFAMAGTVYAQDDTQDASGDNAGGDWHFDIAMYGWLSNVSGDLKGTGEEQHINIPFSDIFKHVQGGFQGYAEVGWRKWFVSFDGTWATLGGDHTGDLLFTDVEIKQEIFDLRLGYGIVRRTLNQRGPGSKKWWPRVALLDVYIGARYFGTKTTIKTTSYLTGNEYQSGSDKTRWDPFFGLRGFYDISRHWSLGFRADIGGFSIGNAAKFTWQVEGNIFYRLSRKISIYAGYRALGYNLAKDNESGETDMVQYGPKIGLGFRF